MYFDSRLSCILILGRFLQIFNRFTEEVHQLNDMEGHAMQDSEIAWCRERRKARPDVSVSSINARKAKRGCTFTLWCVRFHYDHLDDTRPMQTDTVVRTVSYVIRTRSVLFLCRFVRNRRGTVTLGNGRAGSNSSHARTRALMGNSCSAHSSSTNYQVIAPVRLSVSRAAFDAAGSGYAHRELDTRILVVESCGTRMVD